MDLRNRNGSLHHYFLSNFCHILSLLSLLSYQPFYYHHILGDTVIIHAEWAGTLSRLIHCNHNKRNCDDKTNAKKSHNENPSHTPGAGDDFVQ